MVAVDSPLLVGVAGGLGFGFLALASLKQVSLVWPRRFLGVGCALLAVLSLVVASWGFWLSLGDDSPKKEELARFASYERLSITGSDVAHLVTLDLSDRCARLITTGVAFDGDVKALRTENWAAQQSAVAAMNASFFAPYDDTYPWDVYPVEGDEVRILGFAVVDGDVRGMPRNWQGMWPGENVFLDGAGKPGIAFDLPSDATWGVTGKERILAQGEVVADASDPYARSIIGVNAEKELMWWLVIDGKQPGYSSGVSMANAAQFLGGLGATDALAMDGGGSSILVGKSKGTVEVLSRPINQFIPGRSRVVANHVGVVDDCPGGD